MISLECPSCGFYCNVDYPETISKEELNNFYVCPCGNKMEQVKTKAEYYIDDSIAMSSFLNECNWISDYCKKNNVCVSEGFNISKTIDTLVDIVMQQYSDLQETKKDFEKYVNGSFEKCAFCIHDKECEPGEDLCSCNKKSFRYGKR